MITLTARAFKESLKGIKTVPNADSSVPVFWESASEYVKLREDLRAPVIVCAITGMPPDLERSNRRVTMYKNLAMSGASLLQPREIGTLKYPTPVTLRFRVDIESPKLLDVVTIAGVITRRVDVRLVLNIMVKVWGTGLEHNVPVYVTQVSSDIRNESTEGTRIFSWSGVFEAATWLMPEETEIVNVKTWYDRANSNITMNVFEIDDSFTIGTPTHTETIIP